MRSAIFLLALIVGWWWGFGLCGIACRGIGVWKLICNHHSSVIVSKRPLFCMKSEYAIKLSEILFRYMLSRLGEAWSGSYSTKPVQDLHFTQDARSSIRSPSPEHANILGVTRKIVAIVRNIHPIKRNLRPTPHRM